MSKNNLQKRPKIGSFWLKERGIFVTLASYYFNMSKFIIHEENLINFTYFYINKISKYCAILYWLTTDCPTQLPNLATRNTLTQTKPVI